MAKPTPKSGRATGGRTTPKGGGPRVGRPSSAEESGRYTAPIPRNVRRSPRWFGLSILGLALFGILMILLNYLTVLPGSVSIWYLVAGLVTIFVAFIMATMYR